VACEGSGAPVSPPGPANDQGRADARPGCSQPAAGTVGLLVGCRAGAAMQVGLSGCG
jgi:hypothetical protein